jgi:hypothetical protein
MKASKILDPLLMTLIRTTTVSWGKLLMSLRFYGIDERINIHTVAMQHPNFFFLPKFGDSFRSTDSLLFRPEKPGRTCHDGTRTKFEDNPWP